MREARSSTESRGSKVGQTNGLEGAESSVAVSPLVSSYVAQSHGSLESLLERGYAEAIAETLPLVWFNPRVRRILQGAGAIAARHNHQFIGSEHLLLAIIEEGRGPAHQFLQEAGALDSLETLLRNALETITKESDQTR